MRVTIAELFEDTIPWFVGRYVHGEDCLADLLQGWSDHRALLEAWRTHAPEWFEGTEVRIDDRLFDHVWGTQGHGVPTSAARELYAATGIRPPRCDREDCPECHGTGRYTGLLRSEPCRTCA